MDTTGLAVRGEVIAPDHPDYDDARRVWNGAIDRRPAVVVRCHDADDVRVGLRWARDRGLAIAVRGGGHSLPGLSTCEGGVVLDLGRMRSLDVDPATRIAVAGPGLRWADYDAATQRFGLASPGGEISDTGIAGLTLGGGIGWLSRRYGLACDSLAAAEVVTADGRLVRASESEHPDLFWGLRGGGGNFGIVTAFTYRLHPVGPLLPVALGMHPAESAGEALRAVRDWSRDLPDAVGCNVALITAPPVAEIPAHLHGRRVLSLSACATDPDGEAALASLQADGLAQTVTMPYVALQSMVDAAVPPHVGNYVKSEFLRDVDDTVIEALLAGWERQTSPTNQLLLRLMGGAVSRVESDATAFAHRDAAWMLTVVANWTDLGVDPAPHAAWARRVWSDCLPASSGGSYVNHLGDEGEDRIRAAYRPSTWERLLDVKTAWDPDNVFAQNQNIRPRSAAA